MHINVEVKARCADLGRIRDILVERGAQYKGIDDQEDIYFKVPHGRLKLRKGSIENFLIHYTRSDSEGPRQSKVTLFANEPSSSLEAMLRDSLGTLVTVKKRREIYFIGNVKFHIDCVQGLGTFVEIEAIGTQESAEDLHSQCAAYIRLFGIRDEALVKESYSDMLLRDIS